MDKALADVVAEVYATTADDPTGRGLAVVQSVQAFEASVNSPEFPGDGESILDRFFDLFYWVKGHSGPQEQLEKAVYKRENGIDFPPRDFAFVPDPATPSTWKLRLTESPGKVTVAQLGRAAAALGAGGFRGNRVQLPEGVIAAIKRRIRAEYLKLGVASNNIPAIVKESANDDGGQFVLWKQADGGYRWLAIYSNNFRDTDAEIISKDSHELYLKMVETGVVGYPELWHWHVPGTRWGVADWLDYADSFALASGVVDPGHEQEAEALAKLDDIGVSHGMPSRFVMRDANDPSVITMHVTTEISPLPRAAAANKLTGFHVFQEDEMALTVEKKEHLLSLGIPADKVAELEGSLSDAAKAAVAAGIEQKEMTDTTPATQAAVAVAPATPVPGSLPTPVISPASGDAPEEQGDDKVDEPPVTENKAASDPQYITRADFAGVVGELISALGGRIEAIAVEVKALKVADAEKIAKEAAVTPRLSLAELMGQGFANSDQVDGRTALAKSKPTETKQQAASITGLQFLDHLLETSASNGSSD